MEKNSWTDRVKKWSLTYSQGGKKYPTSNKTKECPLDWSHVKWELPSKIHYWRKDRRDEQMRKKT